MANCTVCNLKIATYNYKPTDGTMHVDCKRNQKGQPRIRLMLADRHYPDRRQKVEPYPTKVSDDACR